MKQPRQGSLVPWDPWDPKVLPAPRGNQAHLDLRGRRVSQAIRDPRDHKGSKGHGERSVLLDHRGRRDHQDRPVLRDLKAKRARWVQLVRRDPWGSSDPQALRGQSVLRDRKASLV